MSMIDKNEMKKGISWANLGELIRTAATSSPTDRNMASRTPFL